MCVKSRLQQHIRNLTKDGEIVAQFLVDTVQGKTPGVKPCHQLEAMKYLDRYGFSDEANEEPSQFWGLIPTPEELATTEQTPSSSPSCTSMSVSYLDILNYDIAHLIRQETADGHTIAEFLSDVMTRRDRAYTPKKLRIRHTDRMAAAREILRRGFGHFGRKRKLVVDEHDDNNRDDNDYDTLHTDLAKRMREYSEHGTDAVRFLLDVMEDANPDEPYTWHHRMSAAHELLRRGWDTNYDAITPEMLQDYWRDQHSTRLSVGQKKHLAGLPVSLDDYNTYDNTDYQAIAQSIREHEDLDAEDLESISPVESSPLSPRERARVRGNASASSPSQNNAAISNRHSREACPRPRPENGNPEGWSTAGQKPPLPAGEGWGEGNEKSHSSPPSMSIPSDPDDKPDCYHESLNPEQQAIFDYQMQIESGEYKEGEITIRQPTPEDWKAHEAALASLKELAAAEGVPLLPNPLADTLKMPTIRSP